MNSVPTNGDVVVAFLQSKSRLKRKTHEIPNTFRVTAPWRFVSVSRPSPRCCWRGFMDLVDNAPRAVAWITIKNETKCFLAKVVYWLAGYIWFWLQAVIAWWLLCDIPLEGIIHTHTQKVCWVRCFTNDFLIFSCTCSHVWESIPCVLQFSHKLLWAHTSIFSPLDTLPSGFLRSGKGMDGMDGNGHLTSCFLAVCHTMSHDVTQRKLR